MKLYHAPKAVNPERTYNFLKLKGKLDAVEIEEISIMKQEHKTDAYRSLSPYAQVPVLILDDGTTITESRAISTYFEALWPEPNLMGNDPKEKALIEMWDRRVEFMFMMQVAIWFRNTHPMMAPLEVPQLPEAAGKAEKSVRKFLKTVDRHLAENTWLAADRFSLADLTFYLTCGFSGVVSWKPHREMDHVGAHYARVKEQLA
ncbi:MAG: glutathione S-transferase N-terminal domain-containing protein [Pseudomonadota bacterium]